MLNPMVEYIPTLTQNAPVTTPTSAEASRAYAKALLGVGKNDANLPIHHWTQGVANMVKALVGGNELYKEQLKERSQYGRAGNASVNQPAAGKTPLAGPTGFANDDEAAGGLVPKKVKTETITPGGGDDDGQPPQEDTNIPIPRPRPQEADGPSPIDQRWPKPQDQWPTYTAPTSALLDAGGGALAFDGTPANETPPAGPMTGSDAIVQALQGGAPKAPFGVRQGGTPNIRAPVGPGGTLPPELLPKKPTISEQQYRDIMSNPYASGEQKALAAQVYLGQNQPMEVPVAGGKIRVSPDGRSQVFIPDIKYNPVKGRGGQEAIQPSYIQPGANGGFVQHDIGSAPAPGAVPAPPASGAPVPAAPPASPSVAPGGAGTAPGATPPPTKLQQLRQKWGDPQSNLAPEEGGIDKSDLPNEIKFGQSQTPQGAEDIPMGGMLGFAPPGAEDKTPPTAGGAAPQQTAQLSDSVRRIFNEMDQRALDFDKQTDFNKEDNKALMKGYTDYAAAGQKAHDSIPQLEAMENLVRNKDFYSGFGSDYVETFKKIQSLIQSGHPEAAAAMEAFQKLAAGSILEDMKSTLQGLGQVRVAEINLLSKAMASPHNTPAGNMAVLHLMQRAHSRIDYMGEVANDYMRGYEHDKDGNLVPRSGNVSKAGLDAVIRRASEAFPSLTPRDIANFEMMFKGYDTKTAADYEKYMRGEAATPAGGSQGTPGKMPAPPPGSRKVP